MPRWWNGRHVGLKIQWSVMAVRVQVPPWVQYARVSQLVESHPDKVEYPFIYRFVVAKTFVKMDLSGIDFDIENL